MLVGKRVAVTAPDGRCVKDAEVLDGRRVTGISPLGKHLFYHFDGGGRDALHVHLALFGKFRLFDERPPPEPKGAVRLRLDTGEHALDLHGCLVSEAIDQSAVQAIRDRIGPDPLDPKADAETVWRRVSKSSAPIAGLLMDQKVVSGLGNIYRAEVLFRQKVPPLMKGKELSREQFDGLWRDSVELLKVGVRYNRIITVTPRIRQKRVRQDVRAAGRAGAVVRLQEARVPDDRRASRAVRVGRPDGLLVAAVAGRGTGGFGSARPGGGGVIPERTGGPLAWATRRWFDWYAGHAIRRHFHAVRQYGGTEPMPERCGGRVVVAATHQSFWDGIALDWWLRRLGWRRRHCLIDARQVRRHPFFRRVGGFGVDLDDPADRLRGLRHAAGLLRQSGEPAALVIFPQGRIEPAGGEVADDLGRGARLIARRGGVRRGVGRARLPDVVRAAARVADRHRRLARGGAGAVAAGEPGVRPRPRAAAGPRVDQGRAGAARRAAGRAGGAA